MSNHGPTPTHRALAELDNRGLLQGIITTNVDCLHTMAGSRQAAEIQGSLGINRCVSCKRHYDDYNIWKHGQMPRCAQCGGPIEAYPFYSRASLEEHGLVTARAWIAQAELILVIGAAGSYGGAYLDRSSPGTRIVQINPGKTAFDGVAEENIKRDADSVFEQLMGR